MSKPVSGTRTGFDWNHVRERLTALGETIGEGAGYSRDDGHQLMRERARKLAQPAQLTSASEDSLDLVVFLLANERYAIETNHVREVLVGSQIEPLPGVQSFVVGVMNLRGEIHVVFDLLSHFGRTRDEAPARPCVLAFGRERTEFGILVEAVEGVEKVAVAEILEPPGFLAGASRTCIRGLTRTALTVLDASQLRADDRLYVNPDRRLHA